MFRWIGKCLLDGLIENNFANLDAAIAAFDDTALHTTVKLVIDALCEERIQYARRQGRLELVLASIVNRCAS